MLSKLFAPLLMGTSLFSNASPTRDSLWVPALGAKWQIVLSGAIAIDSNITPRDASIWDIDLFSHSAEKIERLHQMGKKVICYFSAGTYEKDRPDLGTLQPQGMYKS
jgi:hypothetical protein